MLERGGKKSQTDVLQRNLCMLPVLYRTGEKRVQAEVQGPWWVCGSASMQIHVLTQLYEDGASFILSVRNAVDYLFRNLHMISQTLSHHEEWHTTGRSYSSIFCSLQLCKTFTVKQETTHDSSGFRFLLIFVYLLRKTGWVSRIWSVGNVWLLKWYRMIYEY